ncbi:MAG TPA: diguanylate cyclase [Solirubrobacteraceae bacterium]
MALPGATDGRHCPPQARSWLCRDDFDRERLLDMEHRIAPARKRTFAILLLAIAGVAPWLGWWPMLFLVPAASFFACADRLMPRVSRPELLMFTAWVGSELTIAGAVALQGGARTAATAWLAIPVITLSSRFSMRGIVAGVVIASALVLAVGFGTHPQAVLDSPDLVTAPIALVMCVAVLSMPLMRSEIKHRNDSVIDQLTGMLNRKALQARIYELAQQSAVTGDPVGLIVADLDHFKDVNDTHGHAIGDVVLREVAYAMRKQLRAFDLAYRLGGEEFLVLVPGSDLEQTERLAERVREGVAEVRTAGEVAVTMSLGVAASGSGQAFDYDAVFAEADAALYRAKDGGRNRTCLATTSGRELAALPAAAAAVPAAA